MTTDELFESLPVQNSPDDASEIKGIHTDTRELEPGDLFVARTGVESDGHRYLNQARDAGAMGAVVDPDRIPEGFSGSDFGFYEVHSPEEILTTLLKRFYGDPSERLMLAGVTGTNGKTTTTRFLTSILQEAGYPCASFGTVSHEFQGEEWHYSRTTPSRVELYRGLADAHDRGARAAVLEVSSHALDQGRVDGIQFDLGIFTNLSQDHLDYHGTMDRYFEAKSKLFEQSKQGLARADSYGKKLLEQPGIVGLGENCQYEVVSSRSDLDGIEVTLEVGSGARISLETSITGSFNVWNVAMAASAGDLLGIEASVLREGIKQCDRVPGRCERIDGPPDVIVDYAHTPDALRNLLGGLRDLVEGRLICVFGAGGDRDRTKRPLMARAAEEQADYAIVTSDNPRTEEPEKIIDDVIAGFVADEFKAQVDRGQAIREAITMGNPEDLIVIAGKGHESGIEFADITVPFDDTVVAREVLESLDRYDQPSGLNTA